MQWILSYWKENGTLVIAVLAFILGVVQWSTSRRQSRIELRAYLSVKIDSEETLWFNRSGDPPDEYWDLRAGLVINNAGKTPARKIKHFQGCGQFKKREFPTMVQARKSVPSRMIDIPSASESKQRFAQIVESEGATAVEIFSLENNVRLYGFFEYQDVFGKTHYTQYCYRLSKAPYGTHALMYHDDGEDETFNFST